MIVRTQQIKLLKRKLSLNPAVVLLGPRQVGKTTLVQNMPLTNPRYLDLESSNDLEAIANDPELFLGSLKDRTVILDEVQVYPKLFSVLRSIIDKNRENGKFLLLGSADPKLVRGVSESLAGRVSYIELTPFSLNEIGIDNLEKHWLRGGFPRSYLAYNDHEAYEWLEDFTKSYVERDLNAALNVNLNPVLIRRLWRMLAFQNGGLLNTTELSRSLGVSNNTVKSYLDLMESAFLIFRLQPWYSNVGKRLVKSAKFYLSDTGILHYLLRIKTFDTLMTHPAIGLSWENYVILEIKKIIRNELEMYFYRTHNGAEIDLILSNGIKPIVAIEIKNSNSPKLNKGYYTAIQDLNIDRCYIITRNSSYESIKGISIRSLSDFLTEDLPEILNYSK